MTMTNQTIEEAVEEIVSTVETVEFLHGVPVNLPSQYKADLRGVARKALQAQRDAGARETTAQTEQEMLKRVVEKVRELDKYDYIPVQVKEENPSAWAMYSEGRNKIFKDILASLEIINPKE